MFARNVLAFFGVEVLQIGLGHGTGALLVHVLVHHRHGGLGQDGDRGRDHVELGAEFLFEQIGLVLPRHQHVALVALRKRDGRAACAGVQHGHVAIQLGHKVLGLGVPAVFALGKFPCRQVVPARAARGLGVGRDHLHIRAHQVVPVLDALGIALAHHQHDGGGVGRAVVRQALLPILGDPATVGVQRIGVARQRQRGYVGVQPVDDGAGLLARAAVALLDGHVLAGLGLPVLGKRLVELHIQLARRVVRHIEQRHRLCKRRQCHQGQTAHQGGGEGKLDKVAAKVHGRASFVNVLRCKSPMERILEGPLQNWNY